MKSRQLGQWVVVLAGLAIGPAAVAQWDGGGDGVNWSDVTNWTGDVYPTGQIVLSHNGTVNLDFDAPDGTTFPGHLYVIYGADLNILPGAENTRGTVGGFNVSTHNNSIGVEINQTGGMFQSNYGSLGHGFNPQNAGESGATFNRNAQADYTLSGGSFTSINFWHIGGGGGGDSTMLVNGTGVLTTGTLRLYGDTGIANDTGILTIQGNGQVFATNLTNAPGQRGGFDGSVPDTEGVVNLEGGTLGVNSLDIASGNFNWGSGTLTARSGGATGGVDFTDGAGAPAGPAVRAGTTIQVNGNLATGAAGGSSVLDLGSLYINSGVRVDVLNVTGNLTLTAANDTLTSISSPYFLRPNIGLVVDFGEIPLITVGGDLTGTFDTFVAPEADYLGFEEYTGAWITGVSTADDLPVNTWYLEYDETADTVSFFYKVEGSVPEPGTVGLLGLGLLLVRSLRKPETR